MCVWGGGGLEPINLSLVKLFIIYMARDVISKPMSPLNKKCFANSLMCIEQQYCDDIWEGDLRQVIGGGGGHLGLNGYLLPDGWRRKSRERQNLGTASYYFWGKRRPQSKKVYVYIYIDMYRYIDIYIDVFSHDYEVWRSPKSFGWGVLETQDTPLPPDLSLVKLFTI